MDPSWERPQCGWWKSQLASRREGREGKGGGRCRLCVDQSFGCIFLDGDDIKHGSLIFIFSLFDFLFSFFCICLLAVQPSCFRGYIKLPGCLWPSRSLEKYSWRRCDTWIIWGEQKKTVLNLHQKRTPGLSWTFCLELGDHHFIILSLCYFRGCTWDVKIYWKKSKHNPMACRCACQSQVQVGQGASPKMNGKNGSETKEPKGLHPSPIKSFVFSWGGGFVWCHTTILILEDDIKTSHGNWDTQDSISYQQNKSR